MANSAEYSTRHRDEYTDEDPEPPISPMEIRALIHATAPTAMLDKEERGTLSHLTWRMSLDLLMEEKERQKRGEDSPGESERFLNVRRQLESLGGKFLDPDWNQTHFEYYKAETNQLWEDSIKFLQETLEKYQGDPMDRVLKYITHRTETVMTQDEKERFNEAVQAVNHAVATNQCHFESHLDTQNQVYFRYTIQDDAQDHSAIGENIDLIIKQVRQHKAMRIEMPEGGVLLTPRLPR